MNLYDVDNGKGSIAMSYNANDAVELLYVWIEQDDTGFIQNTGFNLSPNYRFEMTYHENIGYQLTCEENLEYPNIWKKNNIIGLTAVVGENGSGKTSLLYHLAYETILSGSHKDSDHHFHRILKAYKYQGVVTILHNLHPLHFAERTGYRILSSNCPRFEDEEKKLNHPTRIVLTNAPFRRLNAKKQNLDHQTIFFTPEENRERTRDFFTKAAGFGSRYIQWEAFTFLQKEIVAHKSQDDFDHIATVSYIHHLNHQVEVPLSTRIPEISISCVNMESYFKSMLHANYVFNYPEEDTNYSLRKIMDMIVARYQFDVTMDRVGNSFKDVFFASLFFEINFLITHHNLGQFPPEEGSSREFVYYRDETEIQDALMALRTIDPYLCQYYEVAFRDLIELLFILDLDSDMQIAKPKDDESITHYVKIHRTSPAYKPFCEYIDKQMKKPYSFILKHLIIDMPPLSSGEKALQSMFSQLIMPPHFQQIFGKQSIPIKEQILLFLDEIDLYMHPEWQRSYLKLLSDQLKDEYYGKHIQIILTTHSPLVLSDIPTRNIIYLRSGEPKCTIAPERGETESFGANIYSLLKGPFFLARSMGEFAYTHIIGISHDLKQLEANPGDEELKNRCRDYDRVINLIGEPILRNKLIKLYRSIFTPEEDAPYTQDLAELKRLLESSDHAKSDKAYEKLTQLLQAMRSE